VTYSFSSYNDLFFLVYKLSSIFFMKGMMFLNVFEKETLLQFFCHVSRILRLMVSSDSEDDNYIIT